MALKKGHHANTEKWRNEIKDGGRKYIKWRTKIGKNVQTHNKLIVTDYI